MRADQRANNGAEIWRAKMDIAVQQYQDGEITDDVFRALLYGLGFRGARLKDEFDYWKSLMGLPF